MVAMLVSEHPTRVGYLYAGEGDDMTVSIPYVVIPYGAVSSDRLVTDDAVPLLDTLALWLAHDLLHSTLIIP